MSSVRQTEIGIKENIGQAVQACSNFLTAFIGRLNVIGSWQRQLSLTRPIDTRYNPTLSHRAIFVVLHDHEVGLLKICLLLRYNYYIIKIDRKRKNHYLTPNIHNRLKIKRLRVDFVSIDSSASVVQSQCFATSFTALWTKRRQRLIGSNDF